jgi:predicted nucleic acid-binding protein
LQNLAADKRLSRNDTAAIQALLGWSRTRDLVIAGHALAARSILATANTADFAGVPGLAIENWLTAT